MGARRRRRYSTRGPRASGSRAAPQPEQAPSMNSATRPQSGHISVNFALQGVTLSQGTLSGEVLGGGNSRWRPRAITPGVELVHPVNRYLAVVARAPLARDHRWRSAEHVHAGGRLARGAVVVGDREVDVMLARGVVDVRDLKSAFA